MRTIITLIRLSSCELCAQIKVFNASIQTAVIVINSYVHTPTLYPPPFTGWLEYSAVCFHVTTFHLNLFIL